MRPLSRPASLGIVAGLMACGDPAAPEPDCAQSDVPLIAVSSGAPVALVGATVLPMTGEGSLPNHTVVVTGDRITAVGPDPDIRVPTGAVVLDASCRFVLPGLIDSHMHLSYGEEVLLYVANGVTTVREMWGSQSRLDFRADVEIGTEYLAPTMLMASPGIDGTPPFWENSPFATNDPDEAAGFVDRFVRDGYDFVKVYERLEPDVYAAVVARAAVLGIPSVGHVPILTGVDPAIASTQSSIEHLDDYYTLLAPAGQPVTWWQGGIDENKIGSLVNRVVADGVWNVPTLVVPTALMTETERNAFDTNTPELRFLPPTILDLWTRQGNYGQDPSVREPALANMLRFFRALHEAGANIAVGTDGGFSRIVGGYAIHDEMRLMVEAGMPEEAVLAAATREAARMLGRAGEFGTVTVGGRADLLVVNADPRTDIGNLENRAGVVLRGEWMSESRLRELLEAQAAKIATGGGSARSLGATPPHAH